MYGGGRHGNSDNRSAMMRSTCVARDIRLCVVGGHSKIGTMHGVRLMSMRAGLRLSMMMVVVMMWGPIRMSRKMSRIVNLVCLEVRAWWIIRRYLLHH